MAKLTGVKTLNDREIEYGGERYVLTEGPAQLGDIITPRIQFYTDVEVDSYYCLEVKRDQELGFVDNGDDLRGFGPTRKIPYAVNTHHFSIFRRVGSRSEIRALIDKKRAEIAELESLLDIRVGDYVRVAKASYNGTIAAGAIARVDKNDGSRIPYYIKSAIGNVEDWIVADAVEKITPAEAKAALIAQVEALFQSAH